MTILLEARMKSFRDEGEDLLNVILTMRPGETLTYWTSEQDRDRKTRNRRVKMFEFMAYLKECGIVDLHVKRNGDDGSLYIARRTYEEPVMSDLELTKCRNCGRIMINLRKRSCRKCGTRIKWSIIHQVKNR